MNANDDQLVSTPAEPRSSAVRSGKRYDYLWLFLIVFSAVVVLQWSTVKDVYYKLTGIEPPESKIAWRHNFEEALTESSRESKPVLVVFGASWCPPCRAMKREVWPDEAVTEAVESSYIPMYVDVDEPSLSKLSARYQVRGIPAVLIVDESGQVLSRGNYMSASELLAFLRAYVKPAAPGVS